MASDSIIAAANEIPQNTISATRRNFDREMSKVSRRFFSFYASRTLPEINLVSDDASALSIPRDDVAARQGGGLCRLKLSIIDTGFNYLIVSSEVHACVLKDRERERERER